MNKDDQIKELQAEVERLRAANFDNVAWCKEAERERDQLKARCDRLRTAALNAVSMMPGGNTKASLRDAYDETPEQSLAAHDADVIDRLKTEMMTYVAKLNMQPGVEFAVDFMDDKIDQLRQQAKDDSNEQD